MKTVISKIGLVLRLSTIAAALLMTQQALAAGTTQGTTVTNNATVSYTVAGNPQTDVTSNDADFVVDRRVDFTLTGDGNSETVNPGDTGLTFDLTLQNDSNDTLDFVITVEQIASGDPDASVNGNVDTDADVSNVVFAATVEDLGEDANTVVSITGDAGLALVNGDVANLRVIATALDSGGGALTDNAGDLDLPLTVQNVFADLADGVGNEETGYDGIVVQSAALTITKSSSVTWDPINLGANPKSIPGSVVEYLIEIENAGAVDAVSISIQDTVDPSAEFLDASNNPENPGQDPYNGGASNVEFDGGASYCFAEQGGTDTNADGCVLDGADLTIAAPDVTTGNTVEVRFRILIL